LVFRRLAAFLAIISAPSAGAQTGEGGLNPAEEWVVGQVTAENRAVLNKQFPQEKDRKLSAHFLEDLLTGTPDSAENQPDMTKRYRTL
jgi:hypothetical protein